jgi:guanyl-specific ribonuclease Sa
VAIADSPDGPWRKHENNPVLKPGTGDAFDSHRIDDACLIVREGRYWLYYKGRQKGLGPSETKMGLAVAETPTGPFVKHELNPIIDSGHEVCVWPHGQGVAAIVSPVGPQGGTLQYSTDGLHFTAQSKIAPPQAPGPYREDHYHEGSGPGITWGLSHDGGSRDRPFLLRFDCDLRAT